MTEDQAKAVYDVLVKEAGAPESMRRDFVRAMGPENGAHDYCNEYRFCGELGFGGKYWQGRNEVSCYREDETTKRTKIIDKTNAALKELVQEFRSFDVA